MANRQGRLRQPPIARDVSPHGGLRLCGPSSKPPRPRTACTTHLLIIRPRNQLFATRCDHHVTDVPILFQSPLGASPASSSERWAEPRLRGMGRHSQGACGGAKENYLSAGSRVHRIGSAKSHVSASCALATSCRRQSVSLRIESERHVKRFAGPPERLRVRGDLLLNARRRAPRAARRDSRQTREAVTHAARVTRPRRRRSR
jgi:hypothetical protein